LAGSEKRGIINAAADLFEGSLCVLTPDQRTSRFSLEKIPKLWLKVGATTALLSPSLHDRILSLTSHLPHFVAFSLIASIPSEYLKFAAGGLADTTRLSASDSRLWADIALSNRLNILRSLEVFQENLNRIKSVIKKEDRKGLEIILKKAKIKRDSFKQE
jgi:prephenate dehydrogenase